MKDKLAISQATLDDLVLCTTRYYLPRGSIAAISFPQYDLPALYDQCSPMIQEIIIHEIQQYIRQVESGLVKETFKGDSLHWKDFLWKKKKTT